MTIAVMNCLKSNSVCTGAACLKAMNERIRSFEQYKDVPLELVAFGRCSGCENGINEAGFKEKLDRIVSEGAEVCHYGVCTVKEGKECPIMTDAANYLEEHGVKVFRGTH